MKRMVDQERDDDDPSRSIFAALWFRALVVILVLGVIAAVAVPYVLDVVNPPTKPMAKAPGTPTPQPAMTPAPPPPPPAPGPPGAAPSVPAAAPTPAPARPMSKPAEVPKLAEAPKPVEPPKATETPKRAPAKVAATVPAKAAAAGGPYWVQVGAFKNQATAQRVAERLRGQKYRVEESAKLAADAGPASSTPTPSPGPGADLYDVFVSGTSPADLDTKLSSKGLTAGAVAGGVVVKPSLPLREAVALSRDLAADGLPVQVRRSGGAAAAPSTPAAASGDTLHRVRVGSFPDRTSAQAVLRELEGKGYRPFIARGSE